MILVSFIEREQNYLIWSFQWMTFDTEYFCPLINFFNLSTPMSDQDRISPYNMKYNYINQITDENREKYQFEDN